MKIYQLPQINLNNNYLANQEHIPVKKFKELKILKIWTFSSNTLII